MRRQVAIGIWTWLLCNGSVFALNPALDVNQYAHAAWDLQGGVIQVPVNSMAQTADGYMWLGTRLGLMRFDGMRTVPWQPPADGKPLPGTWIRALLGGRDGTLWIGTDKGLVSWKEGRLTDYPALAGKVVYTLLEDRQGMIWTGTFAPGEASLCTIRGSEVQCRGRGSFGAAITSLYEDHAGNLWVGAATGLWRWEPGPPVQYTFGPVSPPARVEASAIIEHEGRLLLATTAGMKQLVDGHIRDFSFPGVSGQFEATSLLHSREGSLWVGTRKGLLHVHEGRIDKFDVAADAYSNNILRLLEDCEGNVWIASLRGLDRFRDIAVPTISVAQGLSTRTALSVQAAPDGSVWIATRNGLNRWQNGQMTVYGGRSAAAASADLQELTVSRSANRISHIKLPQGVGSLALDEHGRLLASTDQGVGYLEGDRFTLMPGLPGARKIATDQEGAGKIALDRDGGVWLLSRDTGLFHRRADGSVEYAPWTLFTHGFRPTTLLPDPVRSGAWIGFFDGGIAYFRDGQVRASYSFADGLGEGRVNDLRAGRDGALWVATDGGLSRLKDGRITTLKRRNGLPCDGALWTMEDDEKSLWLYTTCGLSRIEAAQLTLWLSSSAQVTHPTVFGSTDGVRYRGNDGGNGPSVTKSPDGRIWFVPPEGVSVIDPRHLPFNNRPPPVDIQQVVADDKIYPASLRLSLPPLLHNLTIDYTALSFVAPEKLMFRYKLEGRDSRWQDVGSERQAFYNDLPPGNYRFRVIASNNSGVWNEQGAALDFSIAPAYWQTTWFRAACVAAFLLLMWALYHLRLRQIRQAFNARLEERVGERTRIARDLHDTLLQSFQGLLLRFQTAYELYQTRPADGKKVLESAIDQTAQAITEGREAVQGLRASTIERNDLARAISTLAEEIAAEASSHGSVELHVGVEGAPRTLHPIVRDEIYRIGNEALRNAFRHAEAKRIEVELHYDERKLRLRIRDDGKGIDPTFLTAGGRAGHFGLHGMRERAKLIHGKLTVWTAPGSGTEIELSVPASRAYIASPSPWRSWFTGKFLRWRTQSR